MKRCLLLYLSAGRLLAQRMAGGKLAEQHNFTATAEGRDEFAAFLRTAKFPAYLLVDVIEEDFRREMVPHLRGTRRNALLQRKFEQFYRDTPFHLATLLQRQNSGRRDDDMLFSALTNSALLTPWLDIMQAQHTPLAGIYSVPQISASLLKDHPAEHLLLVSWEKFAGLRQTYFSAQRLQISRLAPIHPGMTFDAAVTDEIAHTCQYLKSLSLFPAGQTLEVRILCHADDRARLESGVPPGESTRHSFPDINELAGRLGLDYLFPDSDATQLFLHQLAVRPPRDSYADTARRHYHHIWRLRRALNWGSATLLLCGLSWAAADVWQSGADADQNASIDTLTRRILAETRQITRSLPNDGVYPADMRAGVSIMRRLDRRAPLPIEILRPLAATLDRHAQIELDELAWQPAPPAPAPFAPAPNTAPAGSPAQIIILKGHLSGFANENRAALGCLERFQHDLISQGYRVTPLTRPLDVSPGGTIDDQHEKARKPFDFSLELSRDHPA